MTERIPIDGFTVSAEPNSGGRFDVYWPNGGWTCRMSPDELERFGIPVPERPLAVGDIVEDVRSGDRGVIVGFGKVRLGEVAVDFDRGVGICARLIANLKRVES